MQQRIWSCPQFSPSLRINRMQFHGRWIFDVREGECAALKRSPILFKSTNWTDSVPWEVDLRCSWRRVPAKNPLHPVATSVTLAFKSADQRKKYAMRCSKNAPWWYAMLCPTNSPKSSVTNQHSFRTWCYRWVKTIELALIDLSSRQRAGASKSWMSIFLERTRSGDSTSSTHLKRLTVPRSRPCQKKRIRRPRWWDSSWSLFQSIQSVSRDINTTIMKKCLMVWSMRMGWNILSRIEKCGMKKRAKTTSTYSCRDKYGTIKLKNMFEGGKATNSVDGIENSYTNNTR